MRVLKCDQYHTHSYPKVVMSDLYGVSLCSNGPLVKIASSQGDYTLGGREGEKERERKRERERRKRKTDGKIDRQTDRQCVVHVWKKHMYTCKYMHIKACIHTLHVHVYMYVHVHVHTLSMFMQYSTCKRSYICTCT